MSDLPQDAEPRASRILSGPEVLAKFVATIESESDLDAATIEAIKHLRAQGKLSATNLLKGLEEARGSAKV